MWLTLILQVFAMIWGTAAVCKHCPLNHKAPCSLFHHLDTFVNNLAGKLLYKLHCLAACTALEIVTP